MSNQKEKRKKSWSLTRNKQKQIFELIKMNRAGFSVMCFKNCSSLTMKYNLPSFL